MKASRDGYVEVAVLLAAIFAGLIPLASLSADEQESPATGEKSLLSLSDLEELARRSNPTLVQAAAAVDQSRGSFQQAGLYPNPQAGYLRTDSDPGGRSRSSGVFIGQEIVTAKKLQKAQAVESADVQRLKWQYQAQVHRVMNDVRIRYLDVLGSEQAEVVARQLVTIAEDGLAMTEKLSEAGQAPRADMLQVRIQLKAAKLTLRECELRHRTAWQQLTHVVGLPDLPLSSIAGTIDGELPLRDFETCWQNVVASSPQLRAAETRISHARAELTSEQARVIPNITVQVVAERDQLNQFNTVNTFLSVPVPVFNRNEGNIRHAHADIREAHQELARTQLALRDSLAEAFLRYDTARAQVETLRDDILPDAKESLDLTMAAYRSGEIGILQVLAARQTYSEHSLACIHAWTEIRKVVAEIDGLLLTGALNPAELGTALQASGLRQQGLLNQVRDASTQSVLPPAIQAGAAGP